MIFFVFFGLLMTFLSYPMNLMVTEFNYVVAAEDICSDTTEAFGFNILVLRGLGMIMMIGVAVWGINRAILVKTGRVRIRQ